MIEQRMTVTPSLVSRVILAERPTRELQYYAKLGRQEHARITEKILNYAAYQLPWEEPVVLPFEIDPAKILKEKTYSVGLRNDYVLRARPDLTLEGGGIIEIKPQLLGRHIIQTILNCMAVAGQTGVTPLHAILYTYKNGGSPLDKVYVLPEGGAKYWPLAEELSINAAKLLSVQERIDELKGDHQNTYKARRTKQEWDSFHFKAPGDYPVDTEAAQEYYELSNYAIKLRRDILEPQAESILNGVQQEIIG
jgi:hypothetical protein